MKRTVKFLLLSLLSLLVFSCKVIGLGEAVDLKPPVLTITKPEIASSVPQTIIVEGSAQDNLGINYLQVSVEETGQAFKYEVGPNKWTRKSGESWVEYTGGNAENNNGVISFTVVVDVQNPKSGKDYTIITQAWDDMFNEGKDSRDDRVVTVDMQEPTLSISEPALFDTYNEVSTQSSTFALNNNAILTYLYNQDITVNGSTKEDSKLDHLVVYFDAGTSDTAPAKEKDITSYIYKKEITGANLRNWSFTVRKSDLPAAYQSGMKIIRVVTFAYDVAGNVENKVTGFFVYWNEADKPWITATYGVDALASVTDDTYPGSVLIGQVFDDDGIKEVSIKTIKYADQQDTTGTVVNELTRTITDSDQALKDHPKYYTFQTNAMGEQAYFSVEVKCKDVNGFESDSVTKYLHVANVVAPTIKVTSNSQIPLNTKEFSIKGEINAPGRVKTLFIFRKPETLSEQDEVKYLNGYSASDENNVWKKAEKNAKNGLYTDADGNKIWVITKFTDTTNQLIKTFEQKLNWETDFGITSTDFSSTAKKLSTQTFILCALDEGDKFVTSNLTMNGDSTAPKITIDSVKVIKSDNTDKETQTLSGTTPELKPYNRDTSNNITDKVELSGTWSDDSTFTSKIDLQWANYNTTINISKNSNGTWKSEPITPPDLSTAAITATIKDIGGNTTTASASFYVNGSMAQYLRISSEKADGAYKTGDTIDIYIQFTKPAQFKGGSNPSLLLSNGATATYSSGNGTEKHVFTYTIASGDTNTTGTNSLNVSKIITNGNKWYDGNNVFYNSDGKSEITSISLNLKENKKLNVDTKAPTITSITKSTSDGHYKADQTLYFLVDFSEDVTITNLSTMKLNLNTGKSTSSVTSTGSKGLMFTYTIQSGDTASPLKVTGIDWGTATIVDSANNSIDKTKSTTTANFANLIVDTTTPADPTFTLPANLTSAKGTTKVLYDTTDQNLVINFAETTGTKKWTRDYNPNGTNNWSDYEGSIPLKTGEWNIAAYQQDEAGNTSTIVTYQKFEVDNKGHILQSITVDKPAAAYSSGEKFTFTVSFRKEIKTPDAKLKINVGSSGKELSPKQTANTPTKTLTFEYTTAEGDALTSGATKLAVTALTGSFADTYGNDVSSLCALSGANVRKFDSEKTITLDTSIPTVKSVTLDGTTLKIEFNSKSTISKGTTTENVVLTMNDTYRAPPYFEKDEWSNYSSDEIIASYYESNTIGCDSSYKADLTERFVLKFDKSITDEFLTGALKTAGADKASMSVNSSDVLVAADGKTLELDFGTKIPVKGAKYKVTIPANLIQNSLSKGNTAPTTEYFVTLAGIEKPAIRVQKGDTTDASYRIDCQTPGSTITYKQATAVSSGITMQADGNSVKMCNGNNDTKLAAAPTHTFTFGDSQSYTDDSAITLTAGTKNDNKGCQIRIEATASKDAIEVDNYTAASDEAYESAMKTVIIFINRGTPADYTYRAIRGGDNIYGGVSTPNFPFSWNVNEPEGIQVMEGSDNTNGAYYYWRTWRLTTTAYINFLATQEQTNPQHWWWASCGWVPDVKDYPVYPGEHSTYDANGVQIGKNNGFGFLDKHKQAASSN